MTDCIKTLETLGSYGKRTKFSYTGSIQEGVVLCQPGNPPVDAPVFAKALEYFAGKSVYGGFSEDDPTRGGFGEWLQKESPHLNRQKLTPRHGSFAAAILCAEGGVRSELRGNAVVLHFPSNS